MNIYASFLQKTLKVNNVLKLRWLLYLIFPLSIIVDLTNGFCQEQLGIYLPIGVVFRMTIIFVILVKIFTRTLSFWFGYVCILCFWFLISLSIWAVCSQCSINSNEGEFKIIAEIDSFVRIAYFYLVFSFFIYYRKSLCNIKTISIISNYGLLIALAIIISFFTGLGNNSYGEDYGFGTKSYFVAGNDLGITLVFCCVTASLKFFVELNLKDFMIFVLMVFSCLLLGTRVGLGGSVIWFVLSLGYLIFYYNNPSHKRKKWVYVVTIVPVMAILCYEMGVFIFSFYDDFMMERLSLEGLSSARGNLIEYATHYILGLSIIPLIFGAGISPLYYFVGRSLTGTIILKSVEADVHEILGAYGVLGIILIFTPYVYFAWKGLRLWIRKKSFLTLALNFVLWSFLAVAYVSGHCVANTMVAPVYSFYIVILYEFLEGNTPLCQIKS